MCTKEEIIKWLEANLSKKRFDHSLGVTRSAVELAARYGEDASKAEIAGLVHDCAREIVGQKAIDTCKQYGIAVDEISAMQPELLHGPIGAGMARDLFGVCDEEILTAVLYHTTGYGCMGRLDKIIYLADSIEPDRDYENVVFLRKLSFEDLDRAMLFSLDSSIRFVLNKSSLLHPNTVEARNCIIKNIRCGTGWWGK